MGNARSAAYRHVARNAEETVQKYENSYVLDTSHVNVSSAGYVNIKRSEHDDSCVHVLLWSNEITPKITPSTINKQTFVDVVEKSVTMEIQVPCRMAEVKSIVVKSPNISAFEVLLDALKIDSCAEASIHTCKLLSLECSNTSTLNIVDVNMGAWNSDVCASIDAHGVEFSACSLRNVAYAVLTTKHEVFVSGAAQNMLVKPDGYIGKKSAPALVLVNVETLALYVGSMRASQAHTKREFDDVDLADDL